MSEQTPDTAREHIDADSRDLMSRRRALEILGVTLFTGLFGDKSKAALPPFDEEVEAMSVGSEWIYKEMGKLFRFVTEQHDSFKKNLKECFSPQELDAWVDYIEKQINLYVYVRVKNKNEERGSLQILGEQGADLRLFVLQRLNRASDFPTEYLNDKTFIRTFDVALYILFQNATAEFAKGEKER